MRNRDLLFEKLGSEIINLCDSFHNKTWPEIYECCSFICFHKEIITQILKCNFSDDLVIKIVNDDNFILNLYSFLDKEKPYFNEDTRLVESLIKNYFNEKED